MARPQIPRVYGIVQFIARLLSLGSIIAGLALLIRLSVRYGKSYWVAYAAGGAFKPIQKKKFIS
jgi:hypothetical protein